MSAIATDTMRPSAYEMIHAYSKSWSTPIDSMPPRLNEATACAYLCMRAVDEIEDHPDLDTLTKAKLLRRVGQVLQIPFKERDIQDVFRGNEDRLPEVSLRLGEWVQLAPADIAPRIWETFSSMAERMACWVERGWRIETKSDLDEYTYAVSGVLVLMLSDLWSWFDHTDSNRAYGISYGRALQATNILIDRVTDKDRGVDFWPEGWQLPQMLAYVKSEMTAATAYVAMLPRNAPARRFCEQPLLNAQQAIKELEFSGLYT